MPTCKRAPSSERKMKKCEVCESTHRVVNCRGQQYLCGRHTDQIYRHGRIFPRTIDPPEIIVREGYCELIVLNKDYREVARAKFDTRHRAKVGALYWSMSSGGYPRCIKLRRNLHQVVKGQKRGFEIDHIDGDKLNNLDSNLRFVTHAQNGKNLKLLKRNKSGYKGVSWDNVRKAGKLGYV